MSETIEKAEIKEDNLVDGPRIGDTRVRVSDIAINRDYHDLSPEEITGEYPVNLSQVYSALSYYRENPRKIREKKYRRESRKSAVRTSDGR